MEISNTLIEFYHEGCIVRAAQSWWELAQQNPRMMRQADERANILFCVQECYAHQRWDWVARFWDLTEELYNGGYWDEYLRLDRWCLVAAQHLNKPLMQAAIYSELGWVALERGASTQARALIQSAFELYVRQGDGRGQLIARRYLATLAMVMREWASARRQLEEVLSMIHAALEKGDPELRPYLLQQSNTVHDSLGIVLQQLNDDAGAERELQLGLEGAATRGCLAVANSLLNLGKLRIKQSRLTEARGLLDECLTICETENFRALTAAARHHLAIVAQMRGEIQPALALAREAWRIYQSLGASNSAAQVAELITSISMRLEN